ncbi:hypothetical protein T4B_8249, partial [Trichinella pseudospiralis]
LCKDMFLDVLNGFGLNKAFVIALFIILVMLAMIFYLAVKLESPATHDDRQRLSGISHRPVLILPTRQTSTSYSVENEKLKRQ